MWHSAAFVSTPHLKAAPINRMTALETRNILHSFRLNSFRVFFLSSATLAVSQNGQIINVFAHTATRSAGKVHFDIRSHRIALARPRWIPD